MCQNPSIAQASCLCNHFDRLIGLASHDWFIQCVLNLHNLFRNMTSLTCKFLQSYTAIWQEGHREFFFLDSYIEKCHWSRNFFATFIHIFHLLSFTFSHSICFHSLCPVWSCFLPYLSVLLFLIFNEGHWIVWIAPIRLAYFRILWLPSIST